jgi:dihydrofolate reductase
MEGGNIFHFVTEGPQAALQKAKEAAQDRVIRVGGGIQVIREYLKLGLVDEMHMAVSPVVLGGGESLLSGIDLLKLGYQCVEHVPSSKAAHFVLAKKK